MKTFIGLILALGVVSLACPPLVAEELTESAKLFEQNCSQCHSTKRVLSKTKTQNAWEETVNRMFKKMVERDPETVVVQNTNERISQYLFEERGYKDQKTGTSKAEERRKKFQDEFPASAPRTVSPRAKTVK